MISRRSLLLLGGVAAVGLGGFAGFTKWSAPAETARTMTPPEALRAAEAGEILLIDIRRPDEWERTGVPKNALPLDMRKEEFLDELQNARVSLSQPVAVICARGIRSARLTRRLEAAGIGPIVDIPEGMLGSRSGPGWLSRELPVIRVN